MVDERVEPTSGRSDPLEVVIDREQNRERRERLLALSARERQFLVLGAAGMSYKAIAEENRVSVRTVERQILRARAKLGMRVNRRG